MGSVRDRRGLADVDTPTTACMTNETAHQLLIIGKCRVIRSVTIILMMDWCLSFVKEAAAETSDSDADPQSMMMSLVHQHSECYTRHRASVEAGRIKK